MALAEVPLPLQPHPGQATRPTEALGCTLWHESSFDLLNGLDVAELEAWPEGLPPAAPARSARR